MGFDNSLVSTKDPFFLFLHNFSGQLLIFLFILIIIVIIIYLFVKPVNVTRDFSLNDANLNQLNQPGLFPNGWIGVCESRCLKDHEIKRIDFCGQRIVLLRSSSSSRKPYALDAFCPHLGADFSVGGKIIKHCDSSNSDCIRCPFHGWLFRANDGLCLEVPYSKDKKPPNGVKARVWECIETNGFIYVWYHAEGHKPTWFPQVIEDISKQKWKYYGRTEHTVNCLVQEIPENGPDFAHLNEIHAPSFMWGGKLQEKSNVLIDSISHRWESTWQKGESSDSHKAILTLKSTTYLFGCKLVELKFDRLEQIGPAIVNLFFCFNFFGIKLKGCYVQSLISLAINKQKIIHHLYMQPNSISPIVAQFLLRVEAIMLERDIQIWSNKIYLKNPKLVKEEKQIAQFRRWYSQFFSSPSELPVKFEDLW